MQNIAKKMPERQCVGCKEKKSKKELIRIVKIPNSDNVEIDLTGKKSGRGAYICPKTECLRKARKRLENSLSCQIPDSLIESLEKEILECTKK